VEAGSSSPRDARSATPAATASAADQLRTRLALVLTALLTGGAFVPTADAQIVNTLRRWSDAEPGWDGDVQARFALARGNTEYLEFAGGASLQFVSERHRVRGFTNASVRRASGEKIAESVTTHLRHNYRLTPAFSTLVFLQHSSDPFRRIDSRTLAGAGTRIDLVREEAWEGSIGFSAMYEGESFTDDPSGLHQEEFRGSFFASAVGRVTETLRLDLSAFYQPLFSDWGDDRLFIASTMRVDVVGELDLVVRFDLQRESRPPVGVEPTDLSLSTGFVLDF
jgi:putative salt-induced outer membrane protein YdiY